VSFDDFVELLACDEEPYEVTGGMALIYPRTDMPPNLKSQLAAGRVPEYAGSPLYGHLGTAQRRGRRLMCEGCKGGVHSLCASEECPCVCNDPDFPWARRKPSQPHA
jgi:hypothetical protein